MKKILMLGLKGKPPEDESEDMESEEESESEDSPEAAFMAAVKDAAKAYCAAVKGDKGSDKDEY